MTMMNATFPTPAPAAKRRMTMVQQLFACEPSDDRCIVPITPTMLPGISVRHSPSCTGNFCYLLSCDGGNWRVMREGTLDRAEWIKGWAITQLLTPRFMDCEEHPLHKRSGGWWADSFRTDGFISGSKLYSLQYRHGGARHETLLLAGDYAKEALQYLTAWGIASRVDVNPRWAAHGHNFPGPFPGSIIHLQIVIAGPGLTSDFTVEGGRHPQYGWLWREYEPPRAIQAIPGRIYGKVAVPRPA